MDSPDLLTLMELIQTRYPSTWKEYPSLEAVSKRNRLPFLVNHSVLHMCKAIGSLSSECEASDHGKELNTDVLRSAATKMVINSIKLAVDLDMTPETLMNELSRIIGTSVPG